jgi:hypothetical protein
MSSSNVKLGGFAVVLMVLAAAGWYATKPKRTADAAVAKFLATADGTPERAAAQAELKALGQRGHEAMFAVLRSGSAEDCGALPLESFTPAQFSAAFGAMGHGGQAAVTQFCGQAGTVELAPVVKAAFAARSADVRKSAVLAAANPKLGLQADVVTMLRDAHPAVRTAALTVLATRPDLLTDESLFPWLNDGDVIVRDTCSTVLLARGRTAEEIAFGRKLCHPNAAERTALLKDLYDEARHRDIAPWLERLAQDHDPVVRAGTLMLAAEVRLPWCDWMTKLTQDADATVKKIALEMEQKLRTGIVPAGGVPK